MRACLETTTAHSTRCGGGVAGRLPWVASLLSEGKRSCRPAEPQSACRALPPLPCGERVGVRGGCSRGRRFVITPAKAGAQRPSTAPVAAFTARAFRACRPPAEGELLLFCLSKREVTKRKRHPARRFLGILPRKSVRCGRAFRQHIPVLAKRNRHPCRFPLRGLSTAPHHRTGAPGKAARVLRALFAEAGSRAKPSSSQSPARQAPAKICEFDRAHYTCGSHDSTHPILRPRAPRQHHPSPAWRMDHGARQSLRPLRHDQSRAMAGSHRSRAGVG
jgi:hypothetical protein